MRELDPLFDPLLLTRGAECFAALAAEPQLQIVRRLLSAHPTGWSPGKSRKNSEYPRRHDRTILKNYGKSGWWL